MKFITTLVLLITGFSVMAQPANDNFANAIVLSNLNTTSAPFAYTNINATADGTTGTCTPINRNVWFKFQATSTEIDIKVLTYPTYGTIGFPFITFYNSSGGVVGCDKQPGVFSPPTIQYLNLTVGTWYYFSVDNHPTAGYSGTFALSISTTVGNDLQSRATTLSMPSYYSGNGALSNINASGDGNSGTCLSSRYKNIWFKFQATTTSIDIRVLVGGNRGTMSAAIVTLYNNAGTAIGCYAATGSAPAIYQSTTLTIGNWYFISVDSNPSVGGVGTFSLGVKNSIGDYQTMASVISTDNYKSTDGAFTTVGAIPDGPSGSCGALNQGSWFKFQASSKNLTIRVLTSGAKGTLVTPFVSLFNSTGAAVSCGNSSGSIALLDASNLTVGAWYYFSVDYLTSGGTFSLEVFSGLASLISQVGYLYQYDALNRMIGKKIPGAEWVYMVYDDRDRLVLTQDGNQRSLNQWSFTKYDFLNRPVLTGIRDTVPLTQAQMQQVVDNYYLKASSRWGETTGVDVHGYTSRSYPVIKDPNLYLTVTYYDNYDWKNNIFNGTRFDFDAAHLVGLATPTGRTTSLVTGGRVKVLDGGTWGGSSWLTSCAYFNERMQTIQSISDNYKGGLVKSSSLVDYTGRVLTAKTTTTEGDPTWKDQTSINIQGNRIFKTGTSAAWDAGLASIQMLPSGTDGWVEATCSSVSGYQLIGLNDSNPDNDRANVDYACVFAIDKIEVWELGVNKFNITGLKVGDVVKIDRIGGTVRYYKNGALSYTSLTSSTTPMLVDVSIFTSGTDVANVRSSFSTISSVVTRNFLYDHAGRLKQVQHQIDSDPAIILSSLQYNELGQQIEKKLHSTNGTAFRQNIDSKYNIRGWLTTVNGSDMTLNAADDGAPDLFGFDLQYYDVDAALGNTARYNGNISAMKWGLKNGSSAIDQRGYVYQYDSMNRIASASFKSKSGATWSLPANNAFSENGYSYDLNGNIKTLTRNGQNGVIDNLQYDYGSTPALNRLLGVSDVSQKLEGFNDGNTTGNDYQYDSNGNLIEDKNKGLVGVNAIAYNHLNLPTLVTRGANVIRYVYDAKGTKLSQAVTYQNYQKISDYLGEYFYENDTLKFQQTEEGRVVRQRSLNQDIPIAYYTLNNTAIDQSGNAHTGTITGGAIGAIDRNGVANGAIQMDGIDDQISIPNHAAFNFGAQDFSVTCWVKKLSATANWKHAYVVTKWNVSGGGQNSWAVTTTSDGTNNIPSFLIDVAGVTHQAVATTSLKLGEWYSITAAKVGGTMKIYVNGVLEGAKTISKSPVSVSTSTTNVYIGRPAATGLNSNMVVDDVNIHSFLLNSGDVKEYQYHLRDHLGNTRVTFTTDNVESAKATLETATMNAERASFLRYDNARRISSHLFDHTNEASAGASTTVYSNDFSSTYSTFQGTGTITLSLSSGRLKAAGATGSDYVLFPVSTVVGRNYRVQTTIDLAAGAAVLFSTYDASLPAETSSASISVNGLASLEFVAQSTTTYVYYKNTGAGARDFYLDDVVVKDISPAGAYSVRLNGTANEKYGLARSLEVEVGDVVNMEVYAKYLEPVSSNWSAPLATLMGQISGGSRPATVIDGTGYSTSTSSFAFAGLVNTTGSSGGPKAYLNWLVFDRNFILLDMGYRRLSATPREYGQNAPHELLSGSVTIGTPGYVYVYLSNEEATPVEVYWDDFKVEHVKSPVVSSQDYYPFGLTFSSFIRGNSTPNQYQYNGKELQDELNVGWLDYGSRMYMSDIGRWGVNDRLSERYSELSPYHYALNNPLRYVDINGDSAWNITNSWTQESVRTFQEFVKTKTQEYKDQGKKFTCEDLALSLLIEFASANGLPVTIVNGEGKFDARSEDFSDVESFRTAVLKTTGAPDLQRSENTVDVDPNKLSAGDMQLLRTKQGVAKHVQVIQNIDDQGNLTIRQGNSGDLSHTPGAGYLGASDPNSIMYTGKPIENGYYHNGIDIYTNTTKNRVIKDFRNAENVQFRRWKYGNF